MQDEITRLLTGNSEAMRALRQRVARIAPFDTNVLLVGETGTGKERVAQALHLLSARREGPLVCINCAALPEQLLESELFGYERGAFTGAFSAVPGKFAMAEAGTLFLDEIAELPRAAQAKLLRVIESREYYRLGGTKPLRANVRLIVATHCDLDAMCKTGEFRSDLYYRLNVARVDLPSLRERANDILELAQHFIRETANQMRRPEVSLSSDALDALSRYPWPGNVRELRNTVEITLINADGAHIAARDLPPNVVRWLAENGGSSDERGRLLATLERLRWNKSATARTLKWSRMKLYRRLQEYGLNSDA